MDNYGYFGNGIGCKCNKILRYNNISNIINNIGSEKRRIRKIFESIDVFIFYIMFVFEFI